MALVHSLEVATALTAPVEKQKQGEGTVVLARVLLGQVEEVWRRVR